MFWQRLRWGIELHDRSIRYVEGAGTGSTLMMRSRLSLLYDCGTAIDVILVCIFAQFGAEVIEVLDDGAVDTTGGDDDGRE